MSGSPSMDKNTHKVFSFVGNENRKTDEKTQVRHVSVCSFVIIYKAQINQAPLANFGYLTAK